MLQKSIFTHMNELAQRAGSVNLGQGFPDYQPPSALLESVHAAMHHHAFQYAPSSGSGALCRVLSQLWMDDWGIELEAESEITVTAGATQALGDAVRSLLRPGDEVVLLDPAYDSYAPAVENAGGIPVRIPLDYSHELGFSLPWDALNDRIHSKTRLMILNHPHNPTGLVCQAEDYTKLEQLMAKHPQLHLLGDEVYAYMVYEGSFHSLLSLSAFRERIMVVHSFGKTFHCTGWKLGYAAGSPTWMKAFRRVHEFNVFCVNSLIQKAFELFLPTDQTRMQIASMYREQRDLLMELIQKGPFWAIPVQGTYFQWIDCSAATGKTALTGRQDIHLAEDWCLNGGCTLIPFSPFMDEGNAYKETFMRVCFAKSTEKMQAGFSNLYKHLSCA